MKCPQCGADNLDGADHCNLCFSKFGQAGGQESEAPGVRPAPPVPAGAVPPAQPLPPGAWTAPGGGPLPPGATGQSPGDAFGYGAGYPPPIGPPPVPVRQGKTYNTTLVWAIRIVVIVVCFAVGWFGMDYILTRPKTFTSSNGSYSFTYPGKWKKADPSGLAVSGIGGGTMTMEIGLADSNSEAPEYAFLAGTTPMLVDWPTAKARMQESAAKDDSAGLPAGQTVTTRTFTDVTIGGKPALSMKCTWSSQGISYDCDFMMVQNGTSLQVFMMMAKKPKGTLDKFQDILKSIKFRS
ncbi:MAG: hypothetical protein ACYC99_00790 [Candidatus Geothermincolia bacterium]